MDAVRRPTICLIEMFENAREVKEGKNTESKKIFQTEEIQCLQATRSYLDIFP